MPSDRPGGASTPTGRSDEFFRLVADYSRSRDDALRAKIDSEIWQRFGRTGTALISDMASFSKISRSHGICHYLGLIHRVRRLWGPMISDHGGQLLKCEADNCYAFFERTDDALAASVAVHEALSAANAVEPAGDRVFLSIGIDFGDLLLIGGEDFFGDPVNTASKLGEDLAGKGETLITRRAIEQCASGPAAHGESLQTRISQIEIDYFRFRHG